MKRFLNSMFALIIACAMIFGFAACSEEEEDENTNVWTAQPDGSASCGAYSMAYYLVTTGQAEVSEIKTKADAFYEDIQFGDAVSGTAYSNFEEYSDPTKIATEIAPYASNVKLKMLENPQSEAEQLLATLAEGLGIPDSDIEKVSSFESAFGAKDYCIEILKSGTSSLHYILTYKNGDELYSRDPDDGKEYKRSEIKNAHPKYDFCGGGVFVTAK